MYAQSKASNYKFPSNSPSNGPKDVYVTPKSWDENSVTWKSFGYAEGTGESVAVPSVKIGTISNSSYNTWETIDVTNAVKKFAATPGVNYGFMVVMQGTYNKRVGYVSSENPTSANRPKLVITYTGGEPVASLALADSVPGVVRISENVHAVKWTSANISGSVKLELLKGSTVAATIAASESNSGTYNWTIPENTATGNDYRIRISGVTATSAVDTSAAFTIMQKTLAENRILAEQSGISAAFVSSEETEGEDGAGVNLLDGNTATIWHSEWSAQETKKPHTVVLKLDAKAGISGFAYTPRQAGTNGIVTKYRIEASLDSAVWVVADSGTWNSDAAIKTASFAAVGAQFIRFTAVANGADSTFSSGSELNLYADPAWVETPIVAGVKQSGAKSLVSLSGARLVLGDISGGRMEIFSSRGQLVAGQEVASGVRSVDLTHLSLSQGLYIVNFTTRSGSWSAVKMSVR